MAEKTYINFGTVINKPINENNQSFYSTCATWCNLNKALLDDKGSYYEIIPLPKPSKEDVAKKVRLKRDLLLDDTDYLLAPDYPISQEDLEAVKVYRQALRDVPQQKGFPFEVTWPEKPVVQKF